MAGRAFSSAASEPAAIIVRVPPWAPGKPPLTGESIRSIPLPARPSAISRASAARMVALRITTEPGCKVDASPSPRITALA